MTTLQLTRRDFLNSSVAGATALGLMGLRAPAARGAAGKRIPVALQLYSVRKDCQKDLPGVLEAVAKMGYEGVEFAGYYGHDADQLKKLLDANGLKCPSTHTRIGAIEGDNLKGTVEFHKTIGAKFITVPGGIARVRKGGKPTKRAWLDAAKQFNEIAEKLKPEGLYTGYHNHSHEFKPIDGETPWDILFGNTSKDVCQQLDTGNCMGGGGDPLALIKKYPGRSRTIHLKEHGGPGDFGKGDTKWKEVFRLCETVGGTEWYIVEQESYVNRTPLECVRQCMDFMRQMGKAKG